MTYFIKCRGCGEEKRAQEFPPVHGDFLLCNACTCAIDKAITSTWHEHLTSEELLEIRNGNVKQVLSQYCPRCKKKYSEETWEDGSFVMYCGCVEVAVGYFVEGADGYGNPY